MKAVVFHGVGDIRLDEVPEPEIKESTDAIVRLTASAICGTDLHIVRGTLSGMKPGTILGHEGVGIVEAIGPGLRNVQVGDRVVIPSTIGCGYATMPTPTDPLPAPRTLEEVRTQDRSTACRQKKHGSRLPTSASSSCLTP
jgi:threonine dehydrogenase-like Zn-dependent dehydrogenase